LVFYQSFVCADPAASCLQAIPGWSAKILIERDNFSPSDVKCCGIRGAHAFKPALQISFVQDKNFASRDGDAACLRPDSR
jgi:hypothetical protein